MFEDINQLTETVIGLAIKVHRNLGPGFLESVYQAALACEMQEAGMKFEKEKYLSVKYADIVIEKGFRCDFFIDDQLVVECKAVNELTNIDQAQLLNYLKISKLQVGLLINFNSSILKNGIKRIVNNYQGETLRSQRPPRLT
ncbi:MAG: GxxExxY protein [Candidatus Marinimicrobia bacterium CG08_land_8_20_14_0_20_45_22]|nr:MAG: GxxExxY protein [Candidatus Marinimicrobia bacterium CG08_land_8_20_14_0_20_45_22]